MGNMEITEKEKEFHKSRIMWVFADGELYWTHSEFGHKEWISNTFKDVDFNTIIRGYIRKGNCYTDIVDIVAYTGDFKGVQLTSKQIYLLIWLANMNYYFSELHIYSSGVKKGKPGECWIPLGTGLVIEYVKDIEQINCISLYDMILYEDFLKKLLSRKEELLTEHREVENEHKVVVNYIMHYGSNIDYTSTTLENISIFKRLRSN